MNITRVALHTLVILMGILGVIGVVTFFMYAAGAFGRGRLSMRIASGVVGLILLSILLALFAEFLTPSQPRTLNSISISTSH